MRQCLLVRMIVIFFCGPTLASAQLVSQDWGYEADGYRIHAKAESMPGLPLGPFDRLPNGDIITVQGDESTANAIISQDEGQTWKTIPIFEDSDKYKIRPERAMLCTEQGTVIIAFMNDPERSGWKWDPTLHDSPEAQLPTYVVRSSNGGQTWEPPQKLHDAWTGAIRHMIQLSDGKIVFTSQMLLHNPGRHATVTYASDDEGKTWTQSNIIDLGGMGHHDGAIESTIIERGDGSLWMLLRTNWGRLWQAISTDGAKTWHPIGPTPIDASAAPAILHRLDSGRLFIAWNRYYYDGTEQYPKAGGDGQWSGTPTSNNRQELSIAFSDDDGQTWSNPVVVATAIPNGQGGYQRGEISYPYVFERVPGEIWLTAWRGIGLRVKLFEQDFQ
ncbi:MAG: exo-alpha-sialidase [Planctomycetaceae bacterium]|nr:exo-alpha-sialidase [Planctomycetaceae bacterium]